MLKRLTLFLTFILRGRAGVARKAHNLEVGGSNPSPATNFIGKPPDNGGFNTHEKAWS